MNPRIKRHIRIIRQGNHAQHVELKQLRLDYLKNPSSFWLLLGFAIMIFTGCGLLLLPVSSQGQGISFLDALFTSTSAVCVTGLTVVDTAGQWSFFGQLVILMLIQTGGFGFMAGGTILLIAFGHKVGLRERLLIGRSIGTSKLAGIIGLIKQMAVFVLVAEAFGALIFFFKFHSLYPPGEALWKSVFHSVSSFNNAGFDLFGQFQSLSVFKNDSLVLIATAILIFLGGISYIVLLDVFNHRGKIRKLALDSKIVLTLTLGLLVFGTFAMLTAIASSDAVSLAGMPASGRSLNAFFQSVTARTAGFSTFNMALLPQWGLFFMMLLMLIGGAAGSAAGGIKVNALGVFLTSIWSTITGKRRTSLFGREITEGQVHQALSIIFLSILFIMIIVFILAITEDADFTQVAFETVSAFGTVGLSTGITPVLSITGKLLIIMTMYTGRLAPLLLALLLAQDSAIKNYRYPEEEIRLG